MGKTAILFTGQGAQSPGMGKDVAEVSPAAAAIFERANAIVGYDLAKLCFEGPAEKLAQTDIQQPAIFTCSAAIWAALQQSAELGEEVMAMAGLSLGEYTALYAAGSIDFDYALKLVKRRGELMQEASSAVPSGMVSALGLDADQVEAICREASHAGLIGAANFNCPGQIVLSGEKAACEAVLPLVEKAGGRAVPLKVAGAFHSPLMQPAADALTAILEQTPIHPPRVPVMANVNADHHKDPATTRKWLSEQLTHPVRWQDCIEKLMSEGIERFIEIGPGRILTGLVKKISRRTEVENISTAADLAARSAR